MFKTTTDRKLYTWNMPNKEDFGDANDWIYGSKFITVQDRRGDIVMMIFTTRDIHADIYNRKFGGKGIISAGFIHGSGITHGESTSIECRPKATHDDSDAIIEFLEHLNNEWPENELNT